MPVDPNLKETKEKERRARRCPVYKKMRENLDRSIDAGHDIDQAIEHLYYNNPSSGIYAPTWELIRDLRKIARGEYLKGCCSCRCCS